jgi:hypothetical protein
MNTNAKLALVTAPAISSDHEACSCRKLPPIVRIVLTQAARSRKRGTITEETFAAQIRRLAREELEPLGLELQVRDLSCGCTRFLIRYTMKGTICDMIECRPSDGADC